MRITRIYILVVTILMYKQYMFVITAAIMLTALVTIGLYSGSETAHAVIVVKKTVTPIMTNASGAGSNMTNATTSRL